MSFAQRLKKARTDRGLSQSELARQLGTNIPLLVNMNGMK